MQLPGLLSRPRLLNVKYVVPTATAEKHLKGASGGDSDETEKVGGSSPLVPARFHNILATVARNTSSGSLALWGSNRDGSQGDSGTVLIHKVGLSAVCLLPFARWPFLLVTGSSTHRFIDRLRTIKAL